MPEQRSSGFHTTHWSLIAALPRQSSDTPDARARAALEHLCSSYWRPLYAFARYSGHAAEDAQDLTQAFLAVVIERGGLGNADPDRGRFRSYLLGAMKHFMANERARAKASKRGGGIRFVQRDISELESRLNASGIGNAPEDADRVFDQTWAQDTTTAALEQLESEWAGRGKADLFTSIRPALTGEVEDRSALAERLGMTENALAVAIHRLRQRYAALVRESVARTVADASDIEDELRYLIALLRKN